MKKKPQYVNQRSVLDSPPGKGDQNFQLGRPNHGLKVTRRLVIVSLLLSFLMAASLVVMMVMYFQNVIYLKDIEHKTKNLVASFKTVNPVNASVMDPSGFQILQSLATIQSSFQTLQAREEYLRTTCEIAGDISFQILQSLATIQSSIQTLQAREEHLRRKCEIAGYISFQILQSLATIQSSIQTLHAREEHLRRTCEIAGYISRCNNKPTDGWKLNGIYLYYFSTEKKNWFDAKIYCIANNSNLVSITSREEQTYLASTRGENNYWIGLTNEKPGGSWYYVDGSAYKEPLFWHRYQPDNWKTPEGKTEHCVEMSRGGLWNDILCSIQSKWICKKQCRTQ